MATINVDEDVKADFEKAVEARLGHKRGNKLTAANEAIRNWINKTGVTPNSKTLTMYGVIEEKQVDLVEKYLEGMDIANKSQRTILNYRTTLSYFQKYVNKPMSTVTEDDIKNYLKFIKNDRKVEGSTMGTYLRQLKSFFNYAYKHRWISNNPTLDIAEIQGERRVNVPLTREDVARLLKTAEDKPRFWLIIKTLYDSMIRVSELTAIRKIDVDFDNRTIKIHGKGAKERTVSISGECASALKKYSENFKYDQKLFDLHTGTVQRDMRNIGMLALLNKDFTPKSLRHAAATHWLQNKGDIVKISKQLGHDNIGSTLTYLDLTWNDVKEDYEKHGPSSRKDKEKR